MRRIVDTSEALANEVSDNKVSDNEILEWIGRAPDETACSLGKLRVLGVPHPIGPQSEEVIAVCASDGIVPDVVVLTGLGTISAICASLPSPLAAIVPVIGPSDRDGPANRWPVDIALEGSGEKGLARALSEAGDLVARMRRLPEHVLFSSDPRLTLLARLAVRDRGAAPRRTPMCPETFVYPDAAAVPELTAVAEDLAERGLLERRFSDVVTSCPACRSGRLSVRELCGSCGSANLTEEAIIHHYRCAREGPEHEFRSGTALVCPKCRLTLEYFGVDYDRPGIVVVCRECNHISSEAGVGYICLECGSAGSTELAEARPIWAYHLSPTGLMHAFSGRTIIDDDLARTSMLQRFVERQTKAGRPFCVLAAKLQPSSKGPQSSRRWEETCRLFARLLREVFIAEVEIIERPPLYVALLAGDRQEEVRKALPEIREAVEPHLAMRPKLDLAVYGPDDFLQIVTPR
jgi:hypothetical protein